MGIGWGTFIGMHAAGDDAVVAAGVKVLVALSPAMYNKDYDLTRQLQLPVALLPAKYDSMDQVMMFINLLAKPWELRCIFKRYGKVRGEARLSCPVVSFRSQITVATTCSVVAMLLAFPQYSPFPSQCSPLTHASISFGGWLRCSVWEVPCSTVLAGRWGFNVTVATRSNHSCKDSSCGTV